MAIHPSRFSGRSQRSSLSPKRGLSGKHSKLVWILPGVTILGAILVAVWTGWGLLRSPQNLPNTKPYPISTNYKERTNLLLVSFDGDEPNFMSLVSVAGSSKIKYLSLDPALQVSLARNYGSYRLGSAWKLGNLDQGQGMNLLRDSVSRSLAVPIDGYLAINRSAWEGLATRYGHQPAQVVTKLSNPYLWFQLGSQGWPAGLFSSLPATELIGVINQIRSSAAVVELSLDQTTLPVVDQPGIRTLDPASFDGRVGKEFGEDDITRAHPRVRIVNASLVPGAAVGLARYVHNLGGEVISIESSEPVKASVIQDHLGGSQLSRRLGPVIKATISSDRVRSRADVEVTIGQDAAGWF